MTSSWALYVEDESGRATDRFQREIESAGFNVVRAYCASDALALLAGVSSNGEIVDLVVLDRKLPDTLGDRALEATGDRLFEEVEKRYPDTPIVVLTGFSDEDFALLVLQRKNALELGLAGAVQRISHFRKGDALKFRETVRLIGDALRHTEDVALEGSLGRRRDTRRVLKRVGQLFGGAVVKVRPAVGGSSDASVWLCDIVAGDGRWLTSVVVKVGPHDAVRPSAGFISSVPTPNVAQPSHSVIGACGGAGGHVAPLAGRDAESIADILRRDEDGAIEAVKMVIELLDGIPAAIDTISLEKFIAPMINWSCAEEIARVQGIRLPDRRLSVQAHLGCLHGDLHPGNVLMDGLRPVFIDFDRQQPGALILDPVSLALGAVFNKFGPLRGRPPTLDAVERSLTDPEADATWLAACLTPLVTGGFGQRERWSAVLAFVLRQLRYDDVTDDPVLRDLAVQLAQRSSAILLDS